MGAKAPVTAGWPFPISALCSSSLFLHPDRQCRRRPAFLTCGEGAELEGSFLRSQTNKGAATLVPSSAAHKGRDGCAAISGCSEMGAQDGQRMPAPSCPPLQGGTSPAALLTLVLSGGAGAAVLDVAL